MMPLGDALHAASYLLFDMCTLVCYYFPLLGQVTIIHFDGREKPATYGVEVREL